MGVGISSTSPFQEQAMTMTDIKLGNKVYSINRQEEGLYIAVHNLQGEPVEFFRFKEGHLAFGWTDEHVAAYCEQLLRK
jgi:hypothetical protein